MNTKDIEKMLGYRFSDRKLLTEALTHSSADAGYSYERLEFLGDAVLELAVSEHLYSRYTDFSEGHLTALRSKLVREDYLSRWAQANDLGRFLILGKGEENNNGRSKKSILCDVVESLLGAIYLDGGFEECRKFCGEKLFLRGSINLEEDTKSKLQELIQHDGGKHSIIYEIIREEGPDHAKIFYSSVTVDGVVLGEGKGSSKKESEKGAAQKALEKIIGEKEYAEF